MKTADDRQAVRRRFSELALGDEASFEARLTPELVEQFASVSGDWNPLHTDAEWSRSTPFGGRIAHGMLLGGLFSRLVGMHLPGLYSVYLGQELRFVRPVPVGEQVTVRGQITGLAVAARTATLRTWVTNARGEIVADGEARVMVQDPVMSAAPVIEAAASADLRHEVVVVTGSSRGIGAATAALLAGRGASVVVNYRQHQAPAEQLARDITARGGKAIAVAADVSDPESVTRLFAQARQTFGEVTALVNNASADVLPRPFSELTWADMERDLNVILRGAFLCTQAALPAFRAARRGAIVNILSTFALGAPPEKLCRYVTAKAALLGFTRALAAELGSSGIRVNALAPGVTDTELSGHLPARIKDVYAFQTPLKRNARPQDIAGAVAFLISPSAEFVNGVVLPVCGGHVMA